MRIGIKFKLAFVAVASITLNSCLLVPGEFKSDLTIKKSGDFAFSYKGQIQLVGLATLLNNELAGADAAGATAEFSAVCYEDGSGNDKKATEKGKKEAAKAAKQLADQQSVNTAVSAMRSETISTAASSVAVEDYELRQASLEGENKGDEANSVDAAADAVAAAAAAAGDAVAAGAAMEERDCTTSEIAEQQADWDEQQAENTKRNDEQKKMMSTLLGGIDPNDPKTIARFTKEVERMAAWNKVEHLGNGLFMIDYATTGRLADNFAFPVIPRYALGEPMIHITRWDNGRVRIEAPSFHNDADTSLAALMGASGIMGMAGGGKKTAEPIAVKGTFTITTDAAILANNTEEGPTEAGAMQVLSWDIGPRTYGPPMALLKSVM